MSNIPLITVDNVSKKYSKSLHRTLWYGVRDILSELVIRRSQSENSTLRRDEFWALQNISFELKRGESLAFIGDNGAGKSTLLKLIYGLIRPDAGKIVLRGKIGAMIELSAGLDPILTGRENIYLRSALFGFSRKEVDYIFDEITDFAELENFIDSPVQFYSSGMSARLSFAISAFLNPEILLVDEVLAVGDIDFQRKCVNHMLKYLSSGGSLILVSHSPYHIQSVCQRGILLDNGRIIFEGTAVDTLDYYFDKESSKTSQIGSSEQTLKVNKPLLIKDIRLESLMNEEIKTGDSVRLQVNYQSLTEIKGVTWAFSIWTHDNLVCITGDANLTPQNLVKGDGQLQCVIPKLTLLSGSYLLKVAIGDLTTFQIIASQGWFDKPFQFKVSSVPTLLGNSMQTIKQLMLIDVDWE